MTSSPPPANRGKGMRNLLPAGALLMSLLIHVAVLLLVGSAVLIQGVIPRQSFEATPIGEALEDTAVMPDPPPEDQIEKPTIEPLENSTPQAASSNDAPATSQDIIVSTSPNGSMSLMPAVANTTSQLGTGLGGAAGRSGSGGGKIPTDKKLIKLFGNTVAASNLGVILDVSASTHHLLLPVLLEIEKNYGNAPTLLAFGCGIGKLKTATANVLPYGTAPTDTPPDKPGQGTTLGQISAAMEKSDKLASKLNKLRNREDVWYIEGGGLRATRLAFQKLIAQKVDTIYWFADFQDGIDIGEAEDLVNELKRNNVTVIMHNFSKKATPPEKTIIAVKTGGQVINQVIK